jgi:hypothetical protein
MDHNSNITFKDAAELQKWLEDSSVHGQIGNEGSTSDGR